MKQADLEHIIRAAATIADDDEIIVVGSQAVLAQFPNAPFDMLMSDEADVYPKNHPERWELIDEAIGELSLLNRPKDRRYCRAAAAAQMAERGVLVERA